MSTKKVTLNPAPEINISINDKTKKTVGVAIGGQSKTIDIRLPRR
jgi:hypothetical protein